MNFIEISEEELEMMNYNDVAHMILEKNNKKMKINELFKEVCNLLKLNDDEYQSLIADFFELLSTDKRFIMLEEGYWDLKIKHNTGMIMESEEEEEEDIILEEENLEDEETDIYENDIKTDDDIEENDLSDLVIIDESDEENL